MAFKSTELTKCPSDRLDSIQQDLPGGMAMSKLEGAGRWSGTWSEMEKRCWRRGCGWEEERPWIAGKMAEVASLSACRWTSTRTFQTLDLDAWVRRHACTLRMVRHVSRGGKAAGRDLPPLQRIRTTHPSGTSDRYVHRSTVPVLVLHGAHPSVSRVASRFSDPSLPALCSTHARWDHCFFHIAASTNHRPPRCVT